MGRKFVSQKKQTKEEMFDALVKNAIDFLDSSLDDLDKRPKNSIVDFYTSIELFLKARLMSEHWTLIIGKPETASVDSFRVGDFQSVYLADSILRLKFILSEPLDSKIIDNFKTLGEHRNQIVHFAHTDYTDLKAIKAGVVVEQWASWHYLYELLTVKWKNIFDAYLSEFERIHKRMMLQTDFIKSRFIELGHKIEIETKSGKTIICCEHCHMVSGVVKEVHPWGNDYSCMVCGVNDTSVLSTDEQICCLKCGKDFEFFEKNIDCCPHCGDKLDTDKRIDMCEIKYVEGDDWWEEGGPHIACCHECQNERPSVFYIDGLWSCVSCFDRGWQAISCPHCDEFVTGDIETIKYLECFKCVDEVSAQIKADGF